MNKKPLGDTGLDVSRVGIGCMMFGLMCDQKATDAIVGAAIDAGINFFDTADIYGGPGGKSEALLGKALGSKRSDVIVATKFGAGGGGAAPGGGSRQYITAAIERSLKLLGTDYIDLYQHHFPDADTDLEETLRALDDLVRSGKVRCIGCSNYTGGLLRVAGEIAAEQGLHRFLTAQNRYSLLTRDIEKDLVPAANEQGVGILPYFPLESGLLTGKYRAGESLPEESRFAKWGGGGVFNSAERLEIVESLASYGEQRGLSVLDLAMGWLTSQPHVLSVIAGVTKPEQVVSNSAAGNCDIGEAERKEIAALASL